MSISLFISVFLALVCAGLVLRYWPKVEQAAPRVAGSVWRFLVRQRLSLCVVAAVLLGSWGVTEAHYTTLKEWRRTELSRAYAAKRREAARVRKEKGDDAFKESCDPERLKTNGIYWGEFDGGVAWWCPAAKSWPATGYRRTRAGRKWCQMFPYWCGTQWPMPGEQ